MAGPVALVGAGEFTPAMDALDGELLAATGRARPRVAIVPTGVAADGEDALQRCAARAIEHFTALGAEVEVVLARDRAGADDPANAQAVAEADMVYLSGGRPDHLVRSLAGSAVWSALLAVHRRGGVLAGCGAGAMVLCAHQPRIRRPPHLPVGYEAALGIVPGAAVLPGYDRLPEPVAALVILRAPDGTVVLGIDRETAAVGRDGVWQVHGRARVTVWRGRRRERLRDGDAFRI